MAYGIAQPIAKGIAQSIVSPVSGGDGLSFTMTINGSTMELNGSTMTYNKKP